MGLFCACQYSLVLDCLVLFFGLLRGAGNSLMTRYAHEEILFLGALRGLIYSYWAALVSRPGAALMGGGGLPPVGSFWYRDIKMTCLRRHCHASCVYTQAMLANLRCARLPPHRGDLVRFSLALAFFSRCSSVNTMGLFTLILFLATVYSSAPPRCSFTNLTKVGYSGAMFGVQYLIQRVHIRLLYDIRKSQCR